MKKLSLVLILVLTTIFATACFGGEETAEDGSKMGGKVLEEGEMPDLPSTY